MKFSCNPGPFLHLDLLDALINTETVRLMYDIIPDLQLSEIADFRALIALNFPLFLLGAPKYPPPK